MKQSYQVFEPIGFTEPIPSLIRPAPPKPRHPMGPGVADSWSRGGVAASSASTLSADKRAQTRAVEPPVRKRTWAIMLAGTVAATAAAVGTISVSKPGALGQQVDQLVGKISGAASQPHAQAETPAAIIAAAPPPLAEPPAPTIEAPPSTEPSMAANPPVATSVDEPKATQPINASKPKPAPPVLSADIESRPDPTGRPTPAALPPQLLSTLPPPAAGITASGPAIAASAAAPAASTASAPAVPASSSPPAKKASEAEDSTDDQKD